MRVTSVFLPVLSSELDALGHVNHARFFTCVPDELRAAIAAL